MILGVSGKAQAGKDTIGNTLIKNHGFIRVASADALKRIAMRTFNWDGAKDARGRKFLQDLATAVRGYDPNFWINITFQEIERQRKADSQHGSSFINGLLEYRELNFVITDVRYINEADYLKKAGATLIRIEREGIVKFDHESETQLDSYEHFDYMISNNDTIEKLETKVSDILERIKENNEKKI